MTIENSAVLVQLDDILAAQRLLDGKIHRTPTIRSTLLGERVGVQLYFKAELFQKTGSFKPRGVLNKVNDLSDEEKARGVISISAGNFAQGLAYASAHLGVDATVIMPETAVQSKIDATVGYGASVVLHGSVKDLLPRCQEIQAERGLTFVHPFDDLLVIAGHGTLGLEMLEDVPEPDIVIVPVGGGGLISGVAAAIKHQNPAVKVIGVEPVGAPAMHRSLEQNAVFHLDKADTIADGLAAPFVGEHNLAHVKHFVDDMVLVTDDEIIESLRLIMSRCKLQPEPSAAASFAALLFEKLSVPHYAKVICVLSGGNVDHSLLKQIL